MAVTARPGALARRHAQGVRHRSRVALQPRPDGAPIGAPDPKRRAAGDQGQRKHQDGNQARRPCQSKSQRRKDQRTALLHLPVGAQPVRQRSRSIFIHTLPPSSGEKAREKRARATAPRPSSGLSTDLCKMDDCIGRACDGKKRKPVRPARDRSPIYIAIIVSVDHAVTLAPVGAAFDHGVSGPLQAPEGSVAGRPDKPTGRVFLPVHLPYIQRCTAPRGGMPMTQRADTG